MSSTTEAFARGKIDALLQDAGCSSSIGSRWPARKVIQLTMDADLVRRVDRRAKRLGTTRSGFTREALRAALERYDEAELEELHRAGYREKPPSNQEFGIPEADHAWGDGPWKDE